MDVTELLTTGQLVRETGYSRENIALAARTGRLKSVAKLPGNLGSWLFSREDVDEWLSSKDRRRPYQRYGTY